MFPPVATYNKLEAPPTLKLLSYLYPDLLEKLKRQDNRLQIYFALCGFFHKQEMFSSFSKCCCCCSVTELCLTLCDPWSVACQASLSFTISRSLLKIMFIGLVMLSNRLILCCPLVFLPYSVSQHEGLFQWVSSPYQVANWSFSFSISPFNEQSGLISFRIDWFDPHAVQGTLKHLLQNQNSKASVLPCSAFIVVQLSHLYLTTGKTIALTIQNCR